MEGDRGRLARWCGRNDGIVSTGDLPVLRIAWGTFRDHAHRGTLIRVHPGVYRHAAHPATFRSRLRAATVAAGVDAFVSGPSLMRLHGVRGEWPDGPEITLLGDRHLDLEGVRVRRIDRLEPRDVGTRDGFPVLAPPVGLLLLGATSHPLKVQTAVHDMVFLGFTKKSLLVDVRNRYGGRGRDGTVALDRAILSLDGDGRATQTNFELGVLRDLRALGLPEPRLQFVVVDADGRRRKLDLAWPELMLDVETDGDRFHLDPSARREMRRRDRALGAQGWLVVRIAGWEWEADRAACLRRVADAVADRARTVAVA